MCFMNYKTMEILIPNIKWLFFFFFFTMEYIRKLFVFSTWNVKKS